MNKSDNPANNPNPAVPNDGVDTSVSQPRAPHERSAIDPSERPVERDENDPGARAADGANAVDKIKAEQDDAAGDAALGTAAGSPGEPGEDKSMPTGTTADAGGKPAKP